MITVNHINRIWRLSSSFGIAAVGLIAAAILLPSLFGYERYVITGNSMAGAMDRGSVVFAKEVPVSELRLGDAITYRPPPGAGPKGNVTHRIHAISRERSGATTLRTKGDANQTPDPWTFRLDRPTQPRAEFDVPHVGHALTALQDRTLRMLVIGLPALLLALSMLAGLWHEAGTDTRRRPEVAA